MTREGMTKVMEQIFAECQKLRGAGQAEYAHREEEAFANFIRVAERMHVDRKQVLMVYAEKHLDGIHSFLNGHKSQREDVRGRINDVIVYMCLLRGMIDEENSTVRPATEEDLAELRALRPPLGASVLPKSSPSFDDLPPA